MGQEGGTGAYRSCGVYVFVWAGKRMPRYRFSSKLMKVPSERGGGKKRERNRKPLPWCRELREALAAGARAEQLPHPWSFSWPWVCGRWHPGVLRVKPSVGRESGWRRGTLMTLEVEEVISHPRPLHFLFVWKEFSSSRGGESACLAWLQSQINHLCLCMGLLVLSASFASSVWFIVAYLCCSLLTGCLKVTWKMNGSSVLWKELRRRCREKESQEGLRWCLNA